MNVPDIAVPLVIKINGEPAHYLLVHGAVVFIPVAALGALGYLVPGWRAWLRIPLLVVSGLAFVFVWAAYLSGNQLKEAFFQGDAAIEHHEELANVLRIVTTVFALAVVALTLYAAKAKAAVHQGTAAATAALAVVTLVYVVLTGDAGAKAAHNYDNRTPSSAPAAGVVSTR
jgi:hypothetical protein